MRPFFLLALLAFPFSACDFSDEVNRPDAAPLAPVVTTIVITDVQGSELGALSASAVDSALSIAPAAPLAADLRVPSLSFPGGGGGLVGPASASLAVYPSLFAEQTTLRLSLPESERVRLFLMPAVTQEGAQPPAIRAGALADTLGRFPALLLADGPTAGTTLEVQLDPQELGMDYGLYRFVLIADGDREDQDVLYAPCVDGQIAGLSLC